MRRAFAAVLRCPACGQRLILHPLVEVGNEVSEGALECACGRRAPIIGGVPRLLPDHLAAVLVSERSDFFRRYPELRPPVADPTHPKTVSTLRAFGDEWRRFPELHRVHEQIFRWYFEDPQDLNWSGLRVLDAGCGMGRWLHFARRAGANVIGMDLSPAIDVVASRESADLVQADLRHPPFVPASFDLVYSLGVLHHLEDPRSGLRALAALVRPGGELRIYVYRSLADEPFLRRALLALATGLRTVTTRLPTGPSTRWPRPLPSWRRHSSVWPRRGLRWFPLGDRLTRGLPLAHYADVPFRMLVAEQFDRLIAPIEGRYRAAEVQGWFEELGFQVLAVLPGLGWRVIARRPAA